LPSHNPARQARSKGIPDHDRHGTSAAAGLAIINATDNLGEFVAQNVVPMVKQRTGNDLTPMLFLAGCLAVAGLTVFVVQGVLGRMSHAAVPAE